VYDYYIYIIFMLRFSIYVLLPSILCISDSTQPSWNLSFFLALLLFTYFPSHVIPCTLSVISLPLVCSNTEGLKTIRALLPW